MQRKRKSFKGKTWFLLKEIGNCCTYQLLVFLGSERNRCCHSYLNIEYPCIVFKLLLVASSLHKLIGRGFPHKWSCTWKTDISLPLKDEGLLQPKFSINLPCQIIPFVAEAWGGGKYFIKNNLKYPIYNGHYYGGNISSLHQQHWDKHTV